eukprot:COSAG02_NODE_1239_length_13713_cov_37.434259_16_plen_81_part_00
MKWIRGPNRQDPKPRYECRAWMRPTSRVKESDRIKVQRHGLAGRTYSASAKPSTAPTLCATTDQHEKTDAYWDSAAGAAR